MRIPLDRQSATPLYQQIKTYLSQGILSGSLASDTRLPASRQLARDLGVNRITVETAYAELEADGLIFSKVGSGTYILPIKPLPPISKVASGTAWPLWQQGLRARAEASGVGMLNEAYAAAEHPELINFSDGSGDSHLFPVDDFRKVLQSIMRRDGISALDYGERSGYAPLRSTLAHILASQGLQTQPENILITAGSQQALSLVSQLLLKPGDVILVENPTYAGALDLFRSLNFKVVGIPTDEQGMQVERAGKIAATASSETRLHHPEFSQPNRYLPEQSATPGLACPG